LNREALTEPPLLEDELELDDELELEELELLEELDELEDEELLEDELELLLATETVLSLPPPPPPPQAASAIQTRLINKADFSPGFAAFIPGSSYYVS